MWRFSTPRNLLSGKKPGFIKPYISLFKSGLRINRVFNLKCICGPVKMPNFLVFKGKTATLGLISYHTFDERGVYFFSIPQKLKVGLRKMGII
jgi:hypothetical protein